MASTSYNAVQVLDLLDTDSSDSGSRETTSTAIGGSVSGLVDHTPSTLILKMGVKKITLVSLSFCCFSLEN